jgi:hypothetical protein
MAKTTKKMKKKPRKEDFLSDEMKAEEVDAEPVRDERDPVVDNSPTMGPISPPRRELSDQQRKIVENSERRAVAESAKTDGDPEKVMTWVRIAQSVQYPGW